MRYRDSILFQKKMNQLISLNFARLVVVRTFMRFSLVSSHISCIAHFSPKGQSLKPIIQLLKTFIPSVTSMIFAREISPGSLLIEKPPLLPWTLLMSPAFESVVSSCLRYCQGISRISFSCLAEYLSSLCFARK